MLGKAITVVFLPMDRLDPENPTPWSATGPIKYNFVYAGNCAYFLPINFQQDFQQYRQEQRI